MRKTLLFSVILFSFTTSYSQMSSGTILPGWDIAYVTVQDEFSTGAGSEQKFVLFSPSIGLALKENVVMGISLSFAESNYEFEPSNHIDNWKQIGGGVFVRKYKLISGNFLLFGQGRIGYSDVSRETGDLANPVQRRTEEGWGLNVALMPGISYKLGKKFFLEAALNDLLEIKYQETKSTSAPSGTGGTFVIKSDRFGITSSASSIPLNIGMRFIFNN